MPKEKRQRGGGLRGREERQKSEMSDTEKRRNEEGKKSRAHRRRDGC